MASINLVPEGQLNQGFSQHRGNKLRKHRQTDRQTFEEGLFLWFKVYFSGFGV
jgi:hypothetical protein